MSTHECVHLVTGSYFCSCTRDGSPALRSAVGENRMLHCRSVCYRCRVIGDGVFYMHRSGFTHASVA